MPRHRRGLAIRFYRWGIAVASAALLLLQPVHANTPPPDARTRGMQAFVLGERETAFQLLASLAATPDREILWALGVMYANGKGTERNFALAMQYFLKAAELGSEPGSVVCRPSRFSNHRTPE